MKIEQSCINELTMILENSSCGDVKIILKIMWKLILNLSKYDLSTCIEIVFEIVFEI